MKFFESFNNMSKMSFKKLFASILLYRICSDLNLLLTNCTKQNEIQPMQEMIVTLATFFHKFEIEQSKQKKVQKVIEGVLSPIGFEFYLKKRANQKCVEKL